MKNYIKILFRGTIFGPIEAPIPFHAVCKLLRVSLSAKPSLQCIGHSELVIVDHESLVPTGFYKLLAIPNNPHEHIEGESHFFVNCVLNTVETQTEKPITASRVVSSSSLPLGRSEMDVVMQGMLHLISSIPPRYTKYNKALGLQIKTALQHVEDWTQKLDILYTKNESSSTAFHPSGVEYSTYLTFTQYRILELLYEVWKMVWERFSPLKRVFNVSKIHTLHKINEAEHILNCLHSWRRILDRQSWTKIQKYVIQMEAKSAESLSSKELFFMPPRLPCDENAGNLVQLAVNRPNLELVDDKQHLADFRIEYLHNVAKDCIYRQKDLLNLMDKMIEEKAAHQNSFPAKAAKLMIHQEMRI